MVVSESLAVHLLESSGGFERVQDDATDTGGTDVDSASERPSSDDESGGGAEWVDWNADDWLDQDYQQRQADVLAGTVDDHLEAIASAETSQTVIDAVESRQADLEG
ncbi:hypothetical protein JT689_01405 (plasmid) [Halobacterium sp. GSL-19]|uniref:hypothetical protein n=1 Tax=Halobacterium sp. GSL-19 TaxID=2812551 RepID=UPI00196571F8|nr:hypothetical protein [Halobacterium sp. GSL-19]QRY21748.1 hypothetical protein JT689_01405 [Halobacterium sp. GSL-19]